MSAERISRSALVAIAAIGLAAGVVASLAGRSELATIFWMLATIPVIAGLAVSIIRDLLAGRVGVDVIALISMSAALALGQPLAGAVVALMYSGGNVLEEIAVARAESNLRALVKRAPRVAHRRIGEGVEDRAIEQIEIGDHLVVKAGEVIPVDGNLTSSIATIDESALTGEPIPVAKAKGERVFSGTLNAGAMFEISVAAVAGDSAYAGIVKLVTAAQTAKAPFVRLADRYALLFLPFTCAIAFIAWFISGDVIRSLAVFVAATPCPLILAAPVAFIAGVARSARRGIIVKGGGPLEALARAHTILFDKTGTLTVGGARLLSIEPAPGEDADKALGLAASLEQASHHVLASAIVQAAMERGIALTMPTDIKEEVGTGLHGLIDGQRVGAGSFDMIFAGRKAPEWARRAARRAEWRSALVVFVAVEGRPIGALLLADEIRADTPRAIRSLRDAGVRRIMMVTGDRAAAGNAIGAALDLDSVLSDCAPSDKVEAVLVEKKSHPTIMVGDGINDAPALASADVGVAMGARGASASSEAADVVILTDRIDRVGEAILIAKRARRIAIESIVAGMGLSTLAMIAATLGWLTPVPAAIAQEAIDVAVILNALRALRPPHAAYRQTLGVADEQRLQRGHAELLRSLERLRSIADALDDVTGNSAAALVDEANAIVQGQVVIHERDDEGQVYPCFPKYCAKTTVFQQ